jgi:hypothetical protein
MGEHRTDLWPFSSAPRNELLRRTLVPEPVKATTSQTYLGFRISLINGVWRYRHMEHPEIAGSCRSLMGCMQEIDELCQPVLRLRLHWLVLAAAVWVVAYVAIAWGMS